MKKKTGIIRWVEISQSMADRFWAEKIPVQHMAPDRSRYYALCEQIEDIQTDKKTWHPIRSINDGVLEC